MVFDIVDVEWIDLLVPSELPKVGDAVKATVYEGGRTEGVPISTKTHPPYTVRIPGQASQKYQVNIPSSVPTRRPRFGFYPELFLAAEIDQNK